MSSADDGDPPLVRFDSLRPGHRAFRVAVFDPPSKHSKSQPVVSEFQALIPDGGVAKVEWTIPFP